jgi:hypothetical protein
MPLGGWYRANSITQSIRFGNSEANSCVDHRR